MTLAEEFIEGIEFAERDLGSPTFNWQGNDYPLIPSVAEIKRELGDGGFTVDLMLNATIQLQDSEGNLIFPGNVTPSPQQKLTYQGNVYRIIVVKFSPTNSYIRITAMHTTRGV